MDEPSTSGSMMVKLDADFYLVQAALSYRIARAFPDKRICDELVAIASEFEWKAAEATAIRATDEEHLDGRRAPAEAG